LLTVLAILAIRLSAEGVREETLRLLIGDAKAAGKATPKESIAKPKPKPPEYRAFDAGDPEVLNLPKMEVTAPKLEALDQRLAKLDRTQRQEEKATTPSWLDSVLNSSIFSIFGGQSAETRAAQARKRVEIMDWERLLTIALADAKTPAERARIKSDIQMLKDLRK
jgi:hypothetical protein